MILCISEFGWMPHAGDFLVCFEKSIAIIIVQLDIVQRAGAIFILGNIYVRRQTKGCFYNVHKWWVLKITKQSTLNWIIQCFPVRKNMTMGQCKNSCYDLYCNTSHFHQKIRKRNFLIIINVHKGEIIRTKKTSFR